MFPKNRKKTTGKTSDKKALSNQYNSWITETFKLDLATHVQVQPIEKSKKDDPENLTCIASLFIPLVKYLRLLAFCPFTIKRDPISKIISYKFYWRSWLTAFSLLISISFFCLSLYLVIYLIWIGFGNEFHEVLAMQGIQVQEGQIVENLSFVSEFGTRLVPATFPLFSIAASLGIANALPKIRRVLNRWAIFQLEYMKAFPHRKDDPFKYLRRYRNSQFILFVAGACVAVSVIAVLMQDCKRWRGCIFPQLHFIQPTVLASFTMLIMVGSHGLHILLFRTLMEVFKQIRIGIYLWCQEESRNVVGNKKIAEYRKSLNENIKKWISIMVFAKQQVNMTGKAVATQLVFLIFINFIYLCLGVFSCLSTKVGSVDGSRGYMLLLFCTWGFSLLIAKAFICDKIVEQEKLIVHQLRKVDVKENVPSLIQLNSLIDLITNDRAEIRFWNVLTLNKSFLLQLIGQVATYLIVLIQFDNIDRDRLSFSQPEVVAST